jgi:hypothetical protein
MSPEQEAVRDIERGLEQGHPTVDLTGFDFSLLAKIPKGRLGKVQRIRLEGSPLKELPDFLGDLTNLRTLWLERNELPSLPDSLGRLANLQQLYLRGREADFRCVAYAYLDSEPTID